MTFKKTLSVGSSPKRFKLDLSDTMEHVSDNKMLKERGIAKELSVRLKQRRRTLKNRNYASSCREKKDEEIMSLEKLKGEEIDEVTKMEDENTRIQDEIKQMETKYQMILEFAREQNLEVVS